MIVNILLIVVIVFAAQSLWAKENLQVIHSHSKMVDVRDGNIFKKSGWRIVPEAKPDVYVTNGKNSKVTFITDCDSISFTVNPKEKYRFVILLNGRDSALTEIRYMESYLDLLKRAGQYNVNEKRVLPKFTYQLATDPLLQSLRKNYKLDSIAGKGDELSRILNVMFWLHNLIPHDGQHGNPTIVNAPSMIEVCKKEHRGLNCRGLAMALNECYLSLGFQSRYITCLPKDSLKMDKDCHVINCVYLKSKDKWIWIDPTNNAYVMDEKGEPLSIEEVRQRIIENKPVKLNAEANWNNKNPVVKEDYLFNYMAKNLYLLECRVWSEYDSESPYNPTTFVERRRVNDRVRLLPLDYSVQSPVKTTYGNGANAATVYLTNNPNVFWQKP